MTTTHTQEWELYGVFNASGHLDEVCTFIEDAYRARDAFNATDPEEAPHEVKALTAHLSEDED